MRLFTLYVSLLLLSNVIYAQPNERESFVYLYPDSVFYAKIIELKTPLFGASHLKADSLKITLDKVKFFQSERGFFANTKDLSFSGTSQFSERISKGKVNLYEKENRHYNFSPGMYGGGLGVSTVSIKNYYNIGFGPLKKASYKNLSADLGSNPESMVFLNKFKATTRTQRILYGAGGGALLGGLIILVSNLQTDSPVTADPRRDVENNDKISAPAIAMIGAGAGCFWASYFISLSKPKNLKRAIDAYNY